MAIRDLVTKLKSTQLLNEAITTDTTTTSAIIDTADFECGLAFFVGASALTDGSYAFSAQEGDESNLSDATAVAAAKINGTLPTVTTPLSSNAGVFDKFGVFSNKRYVRAAIVSTSTTSGATIIVNAVEEGEYQPV